MTLDQLEALQIDFKWLEPLNDTFNKFEMNTSLRQAAFIGQCQHESENFKILEENLNYSANGLMCVWSSRFPNADVANQYANNPEKIANKVYGGRMGNTEDGDGWKYRGRGIIQLTGKENYERCGSSIGVDIVSNPDLLLIPRNACFSAGWYWRKHGLNFLSDTKNFELMTKRINGGILGLNNRIAFINKALELLS